MLFFLLFTTTSVLIVHVTCIQMFYEERIHVYILPYANHFEVNDASGKYFILNL